MLTQVEVYGPLPIWVSFSDVFLTTPNQFSTSLSTDFWAPMELLFCLRYNLDMPGSSNPRILNQWEWEVEIEAQLEHWVPQWHPVLESLFLPSLLWCESGITSISLHFKHVPSLVALFWDVELYRAWLSW